MYTKDLVGPFDGIRTSETIESSNQVPYPMEDGRDECFF